MPRTSTLDTTLARLTPCSGEGGIVPDGVPFALTSRVPAGDLEGHLRGQARASGVRVHLAVTPALRARYVDGWVCGEAEDLAHFLRAVAPLLEPAAVMRGRRPRLPALVSRGTPAAA